MRGKIHGPTLAWLGRAHQRVEKARAAMEAANRELSEAAADYARAEQELERLKKAHP